MSKDTYTVKCRCNNCDYSGPVSFPRGQTVDTAKAECPTCGCKNTLTKQGEVNMEDFKPWHKRYPFTLEFYSLPAIPMNSPDRHFPGKSPTIFCSASMQHEINCDLHDMC